MEEKRKPLTGNVFFHFMNVPREERYIYMKELNRSNQSIRYN